MFRSLVSVLIAVYFLGLQALAAPIDTSIQFDTESGLFTIKHHTVNAVQAGFNFWSGEWSWVGSGIKTEVSGPFDYALISTSEKDGVIVNGNARRISSNLMQWKLRLDPGENQFGGVFFTFNLEPFDNETFVPQLDILPNNDGWSLKFAADEEPLTVAFDPKPLSIGFVGNQREELRVLFGTPQEKLVAGDYELTVDLPMGSVIAPALAERLAPPDTSWYDNLLDIEISPVDLSFLNQTEKPAGKHGMLGVKDGHLEFADGTVARFWGTNITAYSLFQTGQSDTVKQAKRLSKLGFNLVRLHHLDSDWVKPNILGSETETGLELNGEALRSLDWWIKALGDEGTYVQIDLNVGRVFSPAGLDGSEEMVANDRGPTAQGFAYLNAGIEARMKALNRLLLNHVNQYTNLAYRDDPRIAFLLVTNENDLTHHFGNMFLPDKLRPKHGQIYMAEAARFAEEKGLDPDKTWRSWEFGPSKLFLNDFEHGFNERMIADIRSIGSKAPIITTSSWAYMTVAGLPSLTDGEAIAVHSYAEKGAVLETDPRYAPNLTSWMAAASMAGKPLSVTEWNVAGYPSYDRSALPGYVAAIASLQDWSATIEYAYSQSPLDGPLGANQWEMANDPALLAMMSVGALIYRQQHVKPGESIRYLQPDIGDFIDKPLSPITSRAIRTMTETGRWRVALPSIQELDWFKPPILEKSGEVITDMAADFAGSGDEVCEGIRDFCRNWRRGTFTVDTSMTQLASGWIGDQTITLKSATIALKTANAALAIQSLDSKPIMESRSILISMAAQTVPAGGGENAIRSEPVIGKVTVKAAPGLLAYASFGDSTQKPISVRYESGAYVLDLDASLKTYWIILRDG